MGQVHLCVEGKGREHELVGVHELLGLRHIKVLTRSIFNPTKILLTRMGDSQLQMRNAGINRSKGVGREGRSPLKIVDISLY